MPERDSRSAPMVRARRSASVDDAVPSSEFTMAQEECDSLTRHSGVLDTGGRRAFKFGTGGWRKSCLHLVLLLLLAVLVLNFALTIWIFRVIHFNTEGMGLLKVTSQGVSLQGVSEFLSSIYAQEIHSREDTPLHVHSSQNVTLSARDGKGGAMGSLTVAPRMVKAYAEFLQVKSDKGKLILSADDSRVAVGAEKLRVTGPDGALFEHSIETPLIRSANFEDLRLESPTRSLSMDAPKGVSVHAVAGGAEAVSNMDIVLLSRDGMVVLDAGTLRLPKLPLGTGGKRGATQGLYEVCMCPDGRLYASAAGAGSTCHENSQDC
ncbi:gamma-sarcoglycan-like [Anguilla rostrata]|uniref:gamma-sarcoglycan-like n=1 Tax=Anguilla rostrata TaxID=7938 RepID=UPI0030CB3AAD